jgi:Arabinose efflux permease
MRWLISLVFRLVYPLLTFLATSFAVNLSTASLLITIQVGASLLSPLGGMLSDRFGDRSTIFWSGVLFAIGTVVCAWSQHFELFLFGYGIIGLAVAIAMPALQSYVSARSHYTQRGRMLGILELSWALSALIGVPLVTWTPIISVWQRSFLH